MPGVLNNNIGDYYLSMLDRSSVSNCCVSPNNFFSNNSFVINPMATSIYSQNSGVFPSYPNINHLFSNPLTVNDLAYNNLGDTFTSSYQNAFQNVGIGLENANSWTLQNQWPQQNQWFQKNQWMTKNYLQNPYLQQNTTTDLDEVVYDSEKGERLARAARKTSAKLDSTGYCAKGVRQALEKAGLNDGTAYPSAYMWADELAGREDFEEVSIDVDNLDDLPAGAVVVWGKTSSHPHGHIAIALGDGQESSDHIRNQTEDNGRRYSGHRVFIPV